MVRDPRAQLEVDPARAVQEDAQGRRARDPDQLDGQHLDVRLGRRQARLDRRLERRVAALGWSSRSCV